MTEKEENPGVDIIYKYIYIYIGLNEYAKIEKNKKIEFKLKSVDKKFNTKKDYSL